MSAAFEGFSGKVATVFDLASEMDAIAEVVALATADTPEIDTDEGKAFIATLAIRRLREAGQLLIELHKSRPRPSGPPCVSAGMRDAPSTTSRRWRKPPARHGAGLAEAEPVTPPV